MYHGLAVMMVMVVMRLGRRGHRRFFELAQDEPEEIWYVGQISPAGPIANAFDAH
jgi:hypothetical protein